MASTSVLQVSNNYKIRVIDGGTVTVDTGHTGKLVVTGNLEIQGVTFTVNSDNMNIKDNIVLLNSGELGDGVSRNGGLSGIQIDRGPNHTPPGGFSRAQLLWWEGNGVDDASWEDPVSGLTNYGLWVFSTVVGGINGIRTTAIDTMGNNLNLINSGTGVISVTGTNNYESNIVDDDDIPNKKYVDDLINASNATGFTLSAAGQFLYRGATETLPLNIGTAGQILTVDNGLPSWKSDYFNGSIRISDNLIIGNNIGENIVITPGDGGGLFINGNLDILNLTFVESTIASKDSSAIVLDNNVAISQNLNVNGSIIASNLIVNGLATITSNIPTTSISPGTKGEISVSGTTLYVCIATNTWVKTTVTTSF